MSVLTSGHVVEVLVGCKLMGVVYRRGCASSVDGRGWWMKMGKAGGVAKREEGVLCSGRGRAGYIDEGRARRQPPDHTHESGRAKPGWGLRAAT
jgi:hypothetical protein